MTAPDVLVRHYLDALDRALSGLPDVQRWEIVDGVTEHIRTSRAELADDGTEAEVRTILDRLGDPELIAAGAREEADERVAPPPRNRDLRDTIAVLLLTLGALLLPLLGPLVGLLFVAGSPRWRWERKLQAVVVPLGLLTAFTVLVFLAHGYWRMDVLFYAAVLVPVGAGIILAVPPARRPLPPAVRRAALAVVGGLVLLLGISDLGPVDYYGLVAVVVAGAALVGRFGIGETRRPAYA